MSQYFHYAVRTDKDFPAVKAFFENSTDVSGFAVREVAGDNEHWHWYIRSSRKAQPLRVALTRAVSSLKGNGGYSVAECRDIEKYHRYMCKGDAPEVPAEHVWSKGPEWNQDKFDSLHEEYWAENQRMKKRKVGSVQDHVVDEAKRNCTAWDDRRALTKMYIKELVARSKPINTFAVKAAVRVIQCLLCPNEDAIEEVVNAALV